MSDDVTFRVTASVKAGILDIVVTGDVTKDGLEKVHAEVIAIVREHEAKALLCDVRGLNSPRDGFASAYFRTRRIPADVKKFPTAIVTASNDRAYNSFYETTAANAGYCVRFFADEAGARTWLENAIEDQT